MGIELLLQVLLGVHHVFPLVFHLHGRTGDLQCDQVWVPDSSVHTLRVPHLEQEAQQALQSFLQEVQDFHMDLEEEVHLQGSLDIVGLPDIECLEVETCIHNIRVHHINMSGTQPQLQQTGVLHSIILLLPRQFLNNTMKQMI